MLLRRSGVSDDLPERSLPASRGNSPAGAKGGAFSERILGQTAATRIKKEATADQVRGYRGTSLIRNISPLRAAIGP